MPSIFPPDELPHPDAGAARGTASGQGSSTGDPASAPESGLAELEQLLEIEAGTLLHGSGEDEDGGEPGDDQRRTYRHPVEVCRPIGLQLLNDALEPVTAWLLADILDISLGGLCLLITDSTDHHFAPRHRVRVNVTAHPSFGVSDLLGELRWFVKSDYVVTMGIGFNQQLAELPDLLPCRRAVRRAL
ncbi:PilZ domain-containing protein [Vulcanococcus limneticus]|uniref:PilZ domain-containing protein n=1 Tax=Vulcanococcus limneticus TaxID=2170428 RepID=UPI000B9838CD|nr:PilZ domain-containing protein [Vulcanococcus limneticus]MCP9791192.1 PilZ domain-containing protein [Vulcanococcus limneticus MW73D5]MCP9893514.1 PilZ domain-containing protein [Vulcanococcus limneticus Candia 3F8]MCP9896590.1 PilZ domain-containing protein [Vulcanococcus limneticus Candia 3B3]